MSQIKLVGEWHGCFPAGLLEDFLQGRGSQRARYVPLKDFPLLRRPCDSTQIVAQGGCANIRRLSGGCLYAAGKGQLIVRRAVCCGEVARPRRPGVCDPNLFPNTYPRVDTSLLLAYGRCEQSRAYSALSRSGHFPVQLISTAQTQLECQGFSLLDHETLANWEALEASVGPIREKVKTNVYETLCW